MLQVAFVLREHWQFVQCNLVLWMVYTIQSSLEHVGTPSARPRALQTRL